MRLDKLLTQLKYTTRRQALDFIKTHKITINQERIFSVSHKINPNEDKIFIDDQIIYYEDPIHLMIYKPKGYLSANQDSHFTLVLLELIQRAILTALILKLREDLTIDSEGLLVLTTSGELAHQITSPKYHMDKIYEVVLNRPLINKTQLLEGVHILDGKNLTYVAKAKKGYKFKIVSRPSQLTKVSFIKSNVCLRLLHCKVVNLETNVQIGST
jgi:16S rRNA pseudouridine516 synthase